MNQLRNDLIHPLRRLACFGFFVVLFLACADSAHAAAGPKIKDFTTATNLHLQMQLAPGAFGKPANASTGRLSFEAYGRAFDIRLRPNHRLVAPLLASGQLQIEDLDIYAGELPSVPGSWARFSLGAGSVRGAVWDGSNLYLVEPATEVRQWLPKAVGDEATVVIKATDVSFAINEPSLGMVAAAPVAADRLLAHVASMPVPTRRISLGLIVEGGQHEGPVSDEFIGVSLHYMNVADGLFASQLNLHLSVDRLETVYQDATPFSGNDMEVLLEQLANYKSTSPTLAPLGIAHLLTRRTLSDNTVGIAMLASACSPENGVSITQALYGIPWIIIAHEIGHNLGAVHDGEPGACAATPKTFIMAAELNDSEQFSACSRNSMNQFLSQATCLTALAAGDLELVAEPVPSSLYHKEELRFSYFVNNVGTESVFDAETRIQPNAGFQLAGLWSTGYGPLCIAPINNPACELGNMYDGQSLPFLVALVPVGVGPASIVLNTNALNDPNAANNSVTLDFEVQPATRIYAHGVVSPGAGQGTTARSVVEFWNLGDFASAASVHMYTNPVHTLTTPAPACVSTNNYTLDCTLPTLAPGEKLLLPLDHFIGDLQLAPDVQVSDVTWVETTTELHGSTPTERVIHVVSVYGSYYDLRGEFVSMPADVDIGGNTDFTVAVINEGPDAAPGVEVTVSVFNNVQTSITAAPTGACSKVDTRIICQFSELQAGERAEIGVRSTGKTAGPNSTTLTVDKTIGYDADGSNNNVSATHRVRGPAAAPPPPPADSGGGALSIWLLLALALAGLRVRGQ